MGNFIAILDEFNNYHAPLEEGDLMTRFFGTIQQYNGKKQMDEDLQDEIEQHFDYRWTNDKLSAFKTSDDEAVFNQLPIDTQVMMYKEFLFEEFLTKYKRTFCFRNYELVDQPAFYNWDNPSYRNFMFDLLKCLEPRSQEKDQVVFRELDEVNEVIFFTKGCIDIGFEINRKINYVLRLDKDILIGAYNVVYNKRSKYNYKPERRCEGFSIRRLLWKTFMKKDEHKIISSHLRKQIKKDYEIFIMNKVRLEKARAMQKWQMRNDYDGTLMVVDHLSAK